MDLFKYYLNKLKDLYSHDRVVEFKAKEKKKKINYKKELIKESS